MAKRTTTKSKSKTKEIGNDNKGGGQLGNKNAEVWTEEKALDLGNRLLEWIKKPENFYFKVFLFIEEGTDRDTINYLGSKFKSFSALIKKAKDIQRTKIEIHTMTGDIKPIPGLFLLKCNHNVHEENRSDDFDFETHNALNISQYLTKAKDTSFTYAQNIQQLAIGKRILVNRGGTRSSKTYSILQLFADWLFTGKLGSIEINGDIGFYRKALPHLKTTILNDLVGILDERGIIFGDQVRWHKTDHYFQRGKRKLHYGSVNSEAEAQKVRGLGLGAFLLNEANEFDYEIFRQLFMRGNEGVIAIVDFNPSDEYIWINEEIEIKRQKLKNDIAVIVSNFEDNRFLSEERKDRIRELRDTDPEYWQIYGLGNYGSIAGLIYPDWKLFKELPDAGKFIIVHGQDYGYSTSETADIEIKWQKGTKNLYLTEKTYSILMNTADVINESERVNPDNEPTFGDSEDARLTAELRQAGRNIFKPKKTVLGNINLTKSFNLFIHEDSVNLLKEIKHYKWMKVDGKRINKPLKFLDHLMNAMQYGVRGFMNIYGAKYKVLKAIANKKGVAA